MTVIVSLVLAAAVTQSTAPREPEQAVLKAKLGPCSAQFLVKDATGTPVYNATVHVRVRYGSFSVKRADLEVGTNADGKARIEGLPNRARPLVFDVQQGERKATAEQDVTKTCDAVHEVVLK